MKTRAAIDQMWDRQALKAAQAARSLTPGHAAAEGALDADDENERARRRRERVQHEVDPYMHEAPEVASFDVGKMYRDGLDMPANPGYPAMRPVSPEAFRRGPVIAGEAAYSAGYAVPGRAVPVPSAILAPGMISRPLLTDGQARPCAPES